MRTILIIILVNFFSTHYISAVGVVHRTNDISTANMIVIDGYTKLGHHPSAHSCTTIFSSNTHTDFTKTVAPKNKKHKLGRLILSFILAFILAFFLSFLRYRRW